MGNGAFGGYLLLFGLFLLLAGIVIAVSSVGMLSDFSRLSNASMRILIGLFFGLAGIGLLLVGFLSSKRELRKLYYYCEYSAMLK
jgi:hypothetical protein